MTYLGSTGLMLVLIMTMTLPVSGHADSTVAIDLNLIDLLVTKSKKLFPQVPKEKLTAEWTEIVNSARRPVNPLQATNADTFVENFFSPKYGKGDASVIRKATNTILEEELGGPSYSVKDETGNSVHLLARRKALEQLHSQAVAEFEKSGTSSAFVKNFMRQGYMMKKIMQNNLLYTRARGIQTLLSAIKSLRSQLKKPESFPLTFEETTMRASLDNLAATINGNVREIQQTLSARAQTLNDLDQTSIKFEPNYTQSIGKVEFSSATSPSKLKELESRVGSEWTQKTFGPKFRVTTTEVPWSDGLAHAIEAAAENVNLSRSLSSSSAER